MRRAQLVSLLATVRNDPLGFARDIRLAHEAIERDAIQKATEFAPLLALLRRRRPRAVVEIGTERGGSFYAWARVAAPEARLVSVDWSESAVQELVAPETLHAYAADGHEVTVLRGDSHSAEVREAVERALGDRRADFLFLDGDHTYEGVKADFESYAPLVSRGGLVAFHDITAHEAGSPCQVDRFWIELRSRYRTREYVDPEGDRGFGPWGGIGVLTYEPNVSR